MLTGIHFLLTYACNLECDHCFLYCGPRAAGTFTVDQIRETLREARKIGSVEWIYFEGGEPFLYYPLMLEGIKLARDLGFRTGVVTNAYWATSERDAELWLRPFWELGVSDLSISDDSFHYAEERENPARKALSLSRRRGKPASTICIEKPSVAGKLRRRQEKGAPVTGGGVMFRGRAVEKLAKGQPTRSWTNFTECPYENLADPGRVHVDSFGNVHLCQGLSMGNMWERPLSSLVKGYKGDSHPICGPLLNGGPTALARRFGFSPRRGYVDACHFCYSARLALIERFPQWLAPRQVYGLDT